MSSLRSHDDSWDIATSVGSTAVLVAAARAVETDQADPLIRDPYARMLVDGVGAGIWEQLLDESFAERLAEADPEMALIITHMRNYQAVRTHFFDDYFTDAVDAGIRQIVILASGLDTRAYRLRWPPDAVLYEIDQPKVLEYKAHKLDDAAVRPTVSRREVSVDLRFDWPAALTAEGFDPQRPTAWLAEGLLMYLPAEAQDRLFENITALSVPGSRIAAETAAVRAPDRREEMRRRFQRMAEMFDVAPSVDIAELVYNDPDRAELAGWLTDRGWRASAEPAAQEMRRLGRWLELPMADDDGLSTFVTAQRL